MTVAEEKSLISPKQTGSVALFGGNRVDMLGGLAHIPAPKTDALGFRSPNVRGLSIPY